MANETAQDAPEQKAESAPITPPPSEKSVALSGECIFNENITVYSSNRIPQYDKGPVHAYVARGRDKVARNLFAMVCEDHLTPRSLKTHNYISIINPSLVPLVAAGVMDWPMSGKQKYCLIYENTLGNPLMRDDTHGGLGLKPETVLSSIIRPMVGLFQDMRDKDIIHGNIRPSNMFDGGSRNFEKMVLGECLCLPPSYHQPALYETIDRAMTAPIGRGMGLQKEDLYSFGVSLAALIRHYDPTEGMSDEEIVEKKMEDGTYATLLGKDRVTGAILELLRGLLQDDEGQRWTVDDVIVWLDGRRLSPKQAQRRSKATRPISFHEDKYIRPENLAKDLIKNVGDVSRIVESGDLFQWLSRALEDKPATARYEIALKQANEGDKGANYAEALATRMAIALHPEGPIRYRSISLYPDAIGTALTESYAMKRDMNVYVEFFMYYFITQWVDAQDSAVPDVGSLISKFDGARAFLRNKAIGMGLERCIYAMNPEVQCLSEKLSKFYVRTPEDLMHAFEKLSTLPSRPHLFFDRHSAAFLSVKDRKNIDPYLHDLGGPETYRKIIAEMRILATIQKRSQMGKFPGIGAWIVDNLEPIYERFHDRTLRVSLKRKADDLRDSGDLSKIVTIFDSPALYQEDNANFRKAMRQYHDLEQEALDIERELKDEKTIGIETGGQIAALCSAILAGIIIITAAFMAFGSGAKYF